MNNNYKYELKQLLIDYCKNILNKNITEDRIDRLIKLIQCLNEKYLNVLIDELKNKDI